MQKIKNPRYILEDQIGYSTPPFIRPLEEEHTGGVSLSHPALTEDFPGSCCFIQSPTTYRPNSTDRGLYTPKSRDSMSDVPSTNTPRLSEASSLDSPRTSLDNTPTATSGGAQASLTQPSFNPLGSKASPLTLDENRILRQSPDSDALLSSDEEAEQRKHSYFSLSKNSASRRPSYAAEFQNRERSYSLAGVPLSPTSSHPSAPQGDTAAWAAGISGSGGGQSLGPIWNSIWNSEPSRKSPPKPLNMKSHSVAGPSTHSPLFVGSEALPSPTSMAPGNSGDFPIPIPLQPQHRNYRSMSFSVGQLPRQDLEDHTRPRLSPPAMLAGSRPPPPSGLQHRPSRPSLLSEEQYAGQSSPLRSVFETEDDDENGRRDGTSQQVASGYLQQASGNTSAQQQAFARYESMRLRNRSASTASIPSHISSALGGGRDGERIFPQEEFESALADDDDMDFHQFQAEQRRFSEAPRSMSLMYSPAESQRVENLKKQHWQSFGGPFRGLESGSQSRRHSFAGGLPMNEGFEREFGLGTSDLLGKSNVSPPPTYGENGINSLTSRGRYMSLVNAANIDNLGEESFYLQEQNNLRPRTKSAVNTPQSQHHLQQQLHAYQSANRIPQQPSPPPTGSHRSLMGIAPHHAQQPRSQQLLYFVNFKARRGDVFYVQEDTGLLVRKGDLVIVEADRGTDLGTVFAERITWQEAKELKEQHAKEQYNWLMANATKRVSALVGSPPGSAGLHNGAVAPTNGFTNGGPTGAMPGVHGQIQGQDGSTTELKPKMIKRLAQVHEIQTLRDKEANEAKAKRVCQQKVLEHRLPMEILDAEFQMDWKKLTFYYFADSYINFNSLVTDLFKVYKTRIWMSAMNPASFAHPTGLHPPGAGLAASGPLGPIGEVSNEQPSQMMMHPQYAGLSQQYGGGYNPAAGQRGPQIPQQQLGMSVFPPRHSQHASIAPHQDFSHLPQQQHNVYNSSYMNGASGNHAHSTNGEGPVQNGGADAWMALQSLSLHSH